MKILYVSPEPQQVNGKGNWFVDWATRFNGRIVCRESSRETKEQAIAMIERLIAIQSKGGINA